MSFCQDVISLFHKLLHSGAEKECHLKAMSKVLRNPLAQLTFIKYCVHYYIQYKMSFSSLWPLLPYTNMYIYKPSSPFRQENSMHFLVGLLTGSNAACRLQAVRCLLELSHSHHTSVAPACLPSTPYLLTYLSSQSTKFTVSIQMKVCVLATLRRIFLHFFCCVFFLMCPQELCLYTLGNLCPADVVKNKLVAQGIIPALANCIEVNARFRQIHPGKTEFCFLFPTPSQCHAVNAVSPFKNFVCVQNHRFNFAVVEAAGFTLSQLLQTKDAEKKLIP